tara:strand:+ start:41 stop:199 length:159 start_codon:yes stop_codon:yes gene_type:complete
MSTAKNLENIIKEYWPKNGPSTQEIEKYVKKYSKEKNNYQMWGQSSFRSRSI